MKCPACDGDLPPGRPACPHCGAPLPSVGSPPGTAPPAGTPGTPPGEVANPKTEPLPAWDADAEPPWGASSPAPQPAGWRLAGPGGAVTPAGGGLTAQELESALASPPSPAVQDPYGWNDGAPPAAGDPAAPSAGHAGRRRVLLPAIAVAAAAVLAGGLTYALTRGPGHTTATPAARPDAGTATAQAAAVNRVLATGRTARAHLPARLKTCDDVAAGVAGFQRVVQDRRQELSAAQALKVDRLQDGARLRRWMIAAYRSSLDADQAYLAWARDVQARDCGGAVAPLTGPYRNAIAANDKAGPAKRRVVALWRPIARRHGLPVYAWNAL